MRYLKYTYVDAVTNLPVTEAPAANGPKPPAVDGLVFSFALESRYPCVTPVFYGSVPDDANTDAPGVLGVLDEAAFEAARVTELDDRKTALHKRRKLAREMALRSGFFHNGHLVSSDEKSQGMFSAINMEGVSALLSGTPEELEAFNALLGGGWRATDGEVVATDAASLRAMVQSWGAHVARCDAISQAHKVEIDTADHFDDLARIDVSAGYSPV